MSDYGHELLFGSFLTPTNAQPDQAVGLAQLSEQVGLDLATFQDHPYQPGFLDTWTLTSFVAAATDRIRLAPNVANLPLRPPAVMARSVASLDLLSGGRIELGLGAGAFWEAIEAMGGRRLTPGEAVAALAEAIDVIRQVWDTEGRGGVRVDGDHYRVVGAKRGPAPAHDIPIWLGAYKPRMLALTGRTADGWLPSLSYLQPGDLATGNRIIDDSASQAGRSPHEIRRLLNVNGEFLTTGRGRLAGPAEQWAEELADFALSDGMSVFIMASDDPDDLRRFAGEVAPGVRELVSAERSSPSAETPDPERTYRAHEQAAGQQLVDIHDALRAELAQVQDLIEQVAAGMLDVGAARSEINTMTMRQNKWVLGTYCESYCRIVTTHHTVEDRAMFPQLRSADPRLAPVIDRLEQEHHVIHDVLEGVDRALVGFVGAPDGLAQVRVAVDLLSDTLLSHLAYEERELVEPLARLGG